MSSRNWITGSTENYSESIARAAAAISSCEAILIGAGAGMSTSAGMEYGGETFERYFSDFARKYDVHDMYVGGYAPFESLEETWGFWSRLIKLERYDIPAGAPYLKLRELVDGMNYFVLTTNVDHQFQKAGFDKKRLFYTQGDYGLWQCSKPCHIKTYDNREAIMQMAAQQVGMEIPSSLLPKCPICGAPMCMNLRLNSDFVEDDGWRAANRRYSEFVHANAQSKIVYLELGIGSNTPGIIKYPFWQLAAANTKATYICANQGECICPAVMGSRAVLVDGDITQALDDISHVIGQATA